jgi:hypothetical protein
MIANITPCTLILALALYSGAGLADAGVPLIGLGKPEVAIVLVPLLLVFICIVETLILNKRISYRTQSFAGPVIVANIASTVAGLILLNFIPPIYGQGTIEDIVTLGLFVPLFFISVTIEYPVHKVMRKSVNPQVLMRAVVLANLGSYLLMSAFLIGRIVKSAIVYGRFIVEFP